MKINFHEVELSVLSDLVKQKAESGIDIDLAQFYWNLHGKLKTGRDVVLSPEEAKRPVTNFLQLNDPA